MTNRKISKKRGKLFTRFVDIKVAFDGVDRMQLMKSLKEMKVDGNLRRRIKEIYKETRNILKRKDEEKEGFWTQRGVRQECSLSLTLFNVYLADLEEELKNGKGRRSSDRTEEDLVSDICERHSVDGNRGGRIKGHAEKVQETPREENNDVEHRKVKDNDF